MKKNLFKNKMGFVDLLKLEENDLSELHLNFEFPKWFDEKKFELLIFGNLKKIKNVKKKTKQNKKTKV